MMTIHFQMHIKKQSKFNKENKKANNNLKQELQCRFKRSINKKHSKRNNFENSKNKD